MGARMRAFDWASSPLGPTAGWPPSLCTTVGLCLTAPFPSVIFWGPDLVMLYNDACLPILADKHPAALGQRGHDCWPEICSTMGLMLEGGLAAGAATWLYDLMLPSLISGAAERHFTFAYSPIRDETGHVGGVFCPGMETTAQLQGERQEQQPRAATNGFSFRSLVEALPALVWIARPDGFHDYFNQRWYDYTGLSAKQLAGWGWEATWHPADLPDGRVRWLEALRTGQPYEYAARFRRAADGGFHWHLIRAVPLHDRRGQVLRWVGINTDIEEQKHTATELQRVNDELRQFAHVVSHDLSEPLRTISNFLQIFLNRSQTKLDSQDREHLAFAVDGAQRLQRMITDLLDYARAGGQAEAITVVDGEALLARVCDALQVAVTESGAIITHGPLPTVQGDVTRIGQVLQNLIGNALKFRGQDLPRIHVSAQREGQYWRFAIQDNGIGIDPKQAGRLFQVFQRLHTRSEYPGTGIGLAICKKIVERHGGRIWVESTPGEGATFYFTIHERSSQ
jgi:PAS domain S-box-containing protein